MKSLASWQTKLLGFGIVLAFSLIVLGGGKALAFSGSGGGTSGSPYHITTCNQLGEIGSSLTSYYVLDNDIDCGSHADFTDAVITGAFTGTLDGQSHKIFDLTINNASGSNIGLFSDLNASSVVKNMSVFATVSGNDTVGILVGGMEADAQVLNVGAYGTVNCDTVCGGIAGNMIDASNINRSFSMVNVSGVDRLGGIVGNMAGDPINNPALSDTYFNGTITMTGDTGFAGGMVATMDFAIIQNGYAAGTINGGNNVGGIVSSAAGNPELTNVFSAIKFTGSGGGKGPICSVITANMGGNVYFDTDLTGFSSDPNDCDGQPVTNSSDFYDSSKAPLSSWTFDATHWRTNFNTYPSFAPLLDPYMLCLAPNSSETLIAAGCEVAPLGWGTATWEVRWSVHGKNDWHTVNLDDVRFANDVVVSGLTPGTNYDMQFRFTNDWGTSPWGTVEILTKGTAPVSGGKGSGTKVAQTSGSTYTASSDSSSVPPATPIHPSVTPVNAPFSDPAAAATIAKVQSNHTTLYMFGELVIIFTASWLLVRFWSSRKKDLTLTLKK